jgi:PhzF family phenazine biosynthesis protein
MLWKLCDQFDTTGFYPFAENEAGAPNAYLARQFPKRAGYTEDPATGVAACALGAYLTRYCRHTMGWRYFRSHQGHAMGKPSLLEVGAYLENEYIIKTCVSGKARIRSEKSITLHAV